MEQSKIAILSLDKHPEIEGFGDITIVYPADMKWRELVETVYQQLKVTENGDEDDDTFTDDQDPEMTLVCVGPEDEF